VFTISEFRRGVFALDTIFGPWIASVLPTERIVPTKVAINFLIAQPNAIPHEAGVKIENFYSMTVPACLKIALVILRGPVSASGLRQGCFVLLRFFTRLFALVYAFLQVSKKTTSALCKLHVFTCFALETSPLL